LIMPNMSKYLQIFATDSRKELAELNHVLLEVEKQPQDSELINALFRKAHSLKGMAATMGFERLSEVCHALEEPLNRIRGGKSSLGKETIELLFQGADLLATLVEEAIAGSTPTVEYREFIDLLKTHTAPKAEPLRKEKPLARYQPPSTVPVDTHTLDELINIVGEMILRRNRLIELNRPFLSHELEEEMQHLDTLIRDLYSQVLKIRMLPLSTATELLRRVVRDLAQSEGKELDFTLEGDKQIELDRTVIEELMDPLIHLVRNAVDHGIELPAVRREKGKGKGTIRMGFSKEKEMVRIEVEDDGEGVDVATVREQAVIKEFVSREKADMMDEDEVFALLFKPGFTTSRRITTVSGRGVGLDVVKERLERLGGSVQVRSRPEKGTVFVLKAPTSTHIIFALLVRVNAQVYAIPLTKVLATAKAKVGRGQNSFLLHDEEVELLTLREILGISRESQRTGACAPVVIAESRGRKLGLAVDELVAIDQIFVKPLGKPLNRIQGLYGATILGDGSLVLVLELERLG
jgi:two-component system, chemotaxis family, sensor kinase CheA